MKIANVLPKIKMHWNAVFLSILIGILVLIPNVRVFTNIHNPNFKGIYPASHDDEVYYEARVAAVVRGNLGISNIYIKEHETDSFLQTPIAEWLIASVVWATGLSVPLVKIICDATLVPLAVLLLYSLLFFILKRKTLALSYTAFFFLLFINTFGRPINPQITVLLFFTALLGIFKLYTDKTSSTKFVFSLNLFIGFDVGLSLLISPYFGTALMLFYFFTIPLKSFFEIGIMKTIKQNRSFLYIFTPCLFLYCFFMFRLRHLADYKETLERFGLIHTHHLGSYMNIFIGLLGGALFFLARRVMGKESAWIIGSLVISIFVLNLQNIATGEILQFSSHYYMITVVFIFLIMALVHQLMMSQGKAVHTLSNRYVFALILFIFAFLFYHQRGEIPALVASVPDETDFIAQQKKADVFNWLNSNTTADSVVYTLGSDYDFLMPIYTQNKVYYNFYASIFMMSNEETEDRWLNQQILGGKIDKDDIILHQRDFWQNRFIDSYEFVANRSKLTSFINGNAAPNSRIPETELNRLLDRYNKKAAQDPVYVLKVYQIDYIIVSPEYRFYKEANVKLKNSHFVHLLAVINGVCVYRVYQS